MSAILWLIAGVNFTIVAYGLPDIAWTNFIPAFLCLTMGAFIKD